MGLKHQIRQAFGIERVIEGGSFADYRHFSDGSDEVVILVAALFLDKGRKLVVPFHTPLSRSLEPQTGSPVIVNRWHNHIVRGVREGEIDLHPCASVDKDFETPAPGLATRKRRNR
jgi:hypothetical protein